MDLAINDYQPGVCNIGPAEVRARRIFAVIAIVLTLAIGAVLAQPGVSAAARWLLVLPLAGTFVAILQAVFRFCVNFGIRGVQNFGAIGNQVRIEATEAVRADRQRAVRWIGGSCVAAVIVTGAYVWLLG